MKDDLIDLSLQFIAKNWIDISLALLGVFLIVSYIVVYNIQIEPKSHQSTGRVIMMETMKLLLVQPVVQQEKLLVEHLLDMKERVY